MTPTWCWRVQTVSGDRELGLYDGTRREALEAAAAEHGGEVKRNGRLVYLDAGDALFYAVMALR